MQLFCTDILYLLQAKNIREWVSVFFRINRSRLFWTEIESKEQACFIKYLSFPVTHTNEMSWVNLIGNGEVTHEEDELTNLKNT